MPVIQLSNDALIFDWESLPENVQINTDLRDKLFKEVKEKYPLNKFIDVRTVHEMNKYVLNRLKSELKIK